MNQDKKNRTGWGKVFLTGILLAVLTVSGTGLLRQQAASWQQQRAQAQQASLAVRKNAAAEASPGQAKQAETEPPYVSPIDFEALLQENPDTVGWIRIPGTSIDYPIVQDRESNDTYLTRDFYGKERVYGAIFLDADSEPDFSGWNHPIYGHHMRDGSMFQDVVKFKDPEYFKAHPFFYIYTPKRTIQLKAVACYCTDSDGIVRKTRFHSQEEFDEWVMERLKPCSFARIPERPVSSMYVLVTCSYEFEDARTLLFAVETE